MRGERGDHPDEDRARRPRQLHARGVDRVCRVVRFRPAILDAAATAYHEDTMNTTITKQGLFLRVTSWPSCLREEPWVTTRIALVRCTRPAARRRESRSRHRLQRRP